jgi:hypothetical protein
MVTMSGALPFYRGSERNRLAGISLVRRGLAFEHAATRVGGRTRADSDNALTLPGAGLRSSLCVMPEAGVWRAPRMMSGLARLI